MGEWKRLRCLGMGVRRRRWQQQRSRVESYGGSSGRDRGGCWRFHRTMPGRFLCFQGSTGDGGGEGRRGE
eukprot:587567-Hanusia_phi.AAC.1